MFPPKFSLILIALVVFIVCPPISSTHYQEVGENGDKRNIETSAYLRLPIVEEVPSLSTSDNHRYLKGGRGGGSSFGGGGSYGSTSYNRGGSGSGRSPVLTTSVYTSAGRVGYRPYLYGNGRAEDYNCTDSYDETTNVTTTTCTSWQEGEGTDLWIIIVSVVLLSAFGICFCYSQRFYRRNTGSMSGGDGYSNNVNKQRVDLTGQVDAARMEVEGSYVKGNKSSVPRDGNYAYSYRQNGKSLSGTCNLTFVEKDNEGFTITGTTRDPDGMSYVQEGFCNYEGKAYWKESFVTGDVGLEVLNKGTFDFSTHTFKGDWKASSGESGQFESFRLEDQNNGDIAPTETSTTVSNTSVY